MVGKLKNQNQGSLFFSLKDKLNSKHSLYILANELRWEIFEEAFRGLYSAEKGYLKSDHRLSRNFYKGIVGDNINVMLAAAAFNFKRMMNKWKKKFFHFFQTLLFTIIDNIFPFSYFFIFKKKLKMTF